MFSIGEHIIHPGQGVCTVMGYEDAPSPMIILEAKRGHAKTRMMYGSVRSCFPSRFLKEIPEHLLIQPQKELQQQRQQQPSQSQKPKRQLYRFFEDSGSVVPQHNNPPAQSTYQVGMRVRHKTFGDGQITAVTAMSSDTLLEVRFDNGTSKKLMANFAKLQILT